MTGLVKLQKALILVVVIVFLLAIGAYLLNRGIGIYFCHIAIWTLILTGPIRLLWLSKYFKDKNEQKFSILALMIILVIGLTAILKLF